MGELANYGNNEKFYERMAKMVMEPGDKFEVKMTKVKDYDG